MNPLPLGRLPPADVRRAPWLLVLLAHVVAGPRPAHVRAEENPAWDSTLERIAPSVVTIEIDQARAFDTEWNQSSQATGFVVDAERGLILTNRHVVTPGPVVATAVFLNREEVELHAVYRDPVHDFGMYRYDPRKLRFIRPRRCRSIRKVRASARRSVSSATMPVSSCRSSPARSRASIARRPSTASASSTTSTRFTCRRRRARPAGRPARR